MPSILSAACLVLANISSIAYTYTEYRVAAELFANEGKEDYGMFKFALIVCAVICGLTICVFIFCYDNFPLVELLAYHKQVDSAFDNIPRIPYSTFKKCTNCTLRISDLSIRSIAFLFIVLNIAVRGFL